MINIVVDVNEIIKEEENALIHKQYIPDSGIKTQHQFFCKAQLGANYEVRDLIGGSAMINILMQLNATRSEIS